MFLCILLVLMGQIVRKDGEIMEFGSASFSVQHRHEQDIHLKIVCTSKGTAAHVETWNVDHPPQSPEMPRRNHTQMGA